jgi:hypothetical protein
VQIMTNLRFSTAQQVIDAFPVLKEDFKGGNLQVQSIAFVQLLLEAGQILQAFALCAFMLPRREAVGWLCENLRKFDSNLPEEDDALLALAESWVQNPTEKNRGAALAAAMTSGFKTGPAWAAAAAGWSGGDIGIDPAKPVPPPPHLTGQAVKTGFIIGYWNVFGEKRDAHAKAAVRHALDLLQPAG